MLIFLVLIVIGEAVYACLYLVYISISYVWIDLSIA